MEQIYEVGLKTFCDSYMEIANKDTLFSLPFVSLPSLENMSCFVYGLFLVISLYIWVGLDLHFVGLVKIVGYLIIKVE